MAELKRLEARLTEVQMRKLDNIARVTGLNRTDVLRLLIANAFVDAEGMREGSTVLLDTATMAELLRKTRAVGNNLNGPGRHGGARRRQVPAWQFRGRKRGRKGGRGGRLGAPGALPRKDRG